MERLCADVARVKSLGTTKKDGRGKRWVSNRPYPKNASTSRVRVSMRNEDSLNGWPEDARLRFSEVRGLNTISDKYRLNKTS
ncbi:uncharacterized protein PHALS_00428 [Plasmopara halstedii]|uniref:Uncharacterized protein n=1 Tax=Plasmopara halstedii TaxID=4781 RepID=A0A0P1A7J0_PLAHL|nr:uncharacterized protein PHALS_00428 [Plasmopara halstedii]CEG36109.1 hypothetical protein PHALS_00428 [Plasmopara halstedii]|eukprot:XP_024572478.1 hypothetical protein PHALS_00428 [Plasmopara halstedii]